MSTPTQRHVFEAVGGAPALATLVARFYRGVATDPVLRPIYPEPDLVGAEERLRLFLLQYWGGGSAYSKVRGRPRLGARHAPFSVTTAARDRWLVHMRAALDELRFPAAEDAALWSYFRKAAKAMVNVPGDRDQREDRMTAETTADYGVRELVEDVRRVMEGPGRLTDRQAVVERLAPLLRRALLGPGWTDDEFRTEVDGRPGYRYYVNDDGSLQIYGVLFRQGHPTPVHDHVTWGLIGVQSGEQRTTRYWRRDDGSVPGECQVELRSDEVLTHGAVYELLPPHDIHRIEVTSPGEGLSIHVLGADLKHQRRRIFDPDNATCEEVEGVSMAR